MALVSLTQGYSALIDDADLPLVANRKWQVWKRRSRARILLYATATMRIKGRKRPVEMHRYLMGFPEQVDHKNGNGLDNRRENLRIATAAQNQANRLPQDGTTSKYKGVYYERSKKSWRASINPDGKRIKLGTFRSEQDAARAYDSAALYFWGGFARTNFPDSVAAKPAPRKKGRPRKVAS